MRAAPGPGVATRCARAAEMRRGGRHALGVVARARRSRAVLLAFHPRLDVPPRVCGCAGHVLPAAGRLPAADQRLWRGLREEEEQGETLCGFPTKASACTPEARPLMQRAAARGARQRCVPGRIVGQASGRALVRPGDTRRSLGGGGGGGGLVALLRAEQQHGAQRGC